MMSSSDLILCVWLSPAPLLMNLLLSFSTRCLTTNAGILFKAAPHVDLVGRPCSRGGVMVTSILISEYGYGGQLACLREGTGLKERSKGHRAGKSTTLPFGSIWMVELGAIRPAVTIMGWMAAVIPSLALLCIIILETRWQHKVCIAWMSSVCPHLHVGAIAGSQYPKWSLCLTLMRNRSLGVL